MSKKPPGKPPSQRAHSNQPDDDDCFPVGPIGLRRMSDSAFRKQIQDADIILGMDSKTGKDSLFFGKATLERIIKTGKSKEAVLFRCPVNYATDDVEALIALCLTLKGSHCYGSRDGEPDEIMPGLN